MRSNTENVNAFDPIVMRGWRLQKMTWVPADQAVFDINFPPYVEMNPAGAVEILMPAPSAANAGKMFLLSNISANTISISDSAGTAFTTAITLLTLENTIIFCTGSTTTGISWRALATALSS